MTDGMDDRKHAFEAKFANDQQLQFRAEARACKLFGAWIADELGLAGAAATDYASALVIANLDEPGLDDVIDRAYADLTKHGRTPDRAALSAKLAALHALAKEQVMSEIRDI